MPPFTPEQLVAVLGAVTALIAALGVIYSQVRATHNLVNSRMTELLELTATSSHAAGLVDAAAPGAAPAGALRASTADSQHREAVGGETSTSAAQQSPPSAPQGRR